MIWVARLLFVLGIVLGITGAVVRRIYDAREFVEKFGVPKASVMILLVIAIACLGAASVIYTKRGHW